MQAKIVQLGCRNVSHHCSDSYDVFDVAPSSIADSSAFRRALDAAVRSGAITMYLSPPDDPAFHIEIALAAGAAEFEAAATFELEDEFRVAALAPDVRAAFSMGAIAWPLAVRRAIGSGVKSLDDLTNIVFFMHHPERVVAGSGRALSPGEPRFAALRKEWKAFRALVDPLLKPPARPAAPPFVVTDRDRVIYQLRKLVDENTDYWSFHHPDALCVARKLLRSDVDDRFIHPALARNDEFAPSSAIGLLVRRHVRKVFVPPDKRCANFETCFLNLVEEIEAGIRRVMQVYLPVAEDTASAAVRRSPVGQKVAFVSNQARDARSLYHCYAQWIENWYPAL
jgi:hypothetical protein